LSESEYSLEEQNDLVEIEQKGVDDFVKSDPQYKNLVNRKKYKRPEVKIGEWNHRTADDYKKKGLTPRYPLNWEERNFLLMADPKHAFERTVTKIVKIMAPDYDSPKKELKEYIYYYENWYGKDFLSRRVEVGDHVEGFYKEQLLEGVVFQGRVIGERRSGERTRYYIPFSKKAVDDIIKNSQGSNKDTIIYTIKHANRRHEVPYDQFTIPLEELVKFWDRQNNRQYVMHEANPQYS